MRLVDTHVHMFPDRIAQGALRTLAGSARINPSTDGTFFGTLKQAKEWQVDEFWPLNIATNAKQVRNVNIFAHSIKSNKSFSLGSVFPHALEQSLEELAWLKENNIAGIKLHPEYQQFEVADEKFFPIYEFLQQNNMLCYFHAGRDIAFMNTHLASPTSLKKLKKQFPTLKMVFAHLGGWRDWDEVAEQTAGLDVYFDTATIAGHITESELKKIFSLHSMDRILFASDTPWSTPEKELALLKTLKLKDEVFEKICYKNAQELKNSLMG